MQVFLCDQHDQSTRLIEVAQPVEPDQIITPDRIQPKQKRTWILEQQEQVCGCVERYQIVEVFTSPAHHQTLNANSFSQVIVAKRVNGGCLN